MGQIGGMIAPPAIIKDFEDPVSIKLLPGKHDTQQQLYLRHSQATDVFFNNEPVKG